MNVLTIKVAAAGRWPEILAALGGIPAEVLDGQHHPCPKCGGKDRFRMIDTDAGGAILQLLSQRKKRGWIFCPTVGHGATISGRRQASR